MCRGGKSVSSFPSHIDDTSVVIVTPLYSPDVEAFPTLATSSSTWLAVHLGLGVQSCMLHVHGVCRGAMFGIYHSCNNRTFLYTPPVLFTPENNDND